MIAAKPTGFTLMEVLVALVVLSLAFSTVFMGISSNARNLTYLQNKTAASWVALNAIAEAQLQVDADKSKHEQKMFDKTWYWHSTLKGTPNREVSQMDVEVKSSSESTPIVYLIGYIRNDKK